MEEEKFQVSLGFKLDLERILKTLKGNTEFKGQIGNITIKYIGEYEKEDKKSYIFEIEEAENGQN